MDAQKLKFMMSMQQEIDKLKATLGENNSEVLELVKQFEFLSQSEINKINKTVSSIDLTSIKIDTKIIRECLEIRGDYSIDYSFIRKKIVKEQLMIDNLKMENSFLDTTLKNDIDRFYNFCVNAFYQLEELLNYYYHSSIKTIEDLILALQANPKIRFNRTDKIKEVGDIAFYYKLELFCFSNFGKEEKSTFHAIRNVRNEEMHRCSILIDESKNLYEEYNKLQEKKRKYNLINKNLKILYKNSDEEWKIENEVSFVNFLKDRNFNLVRKSVFNLAEKIKENILLKKRL